ncbi:hypothetical protein [Nocardia wallacei]|uniref:hypothetical protein n=1 Tax=Nocardia wallacei TaxID=480035 RepID=UPI00245377A1|nr:hypothetical protein [Nocardia wallacei]
MAVFYRGEAPIDVRLGDEDVLQLYLGDVLLWDGTIPVIVNAPPALGTGAVPAPTLVVGAVLDVPAALGTGVVPVPDIAGGAGVDAPAALGTGAVPSPDLSVGVVIAAPAAPGTGIVPAPAVGETVVDASPALGTGTVPPPAFSGGATMPGIEATGGGEAPDPVVSTGVTVGTPAATGTGSVPAPEFVSFAPSSMTKNGAFSLSSTSYVKVTGWAADTTGYPGSTVTSDELVIQAAATGVTIAASVIWTGSSFARTVTMRLLQNGAVIATGTAASIPVSPGTGTATVAATNVTVAAGDVIRLEALKDFGTGNPTANTNTASYVRATKPS